MGCRAAGFLSIFSNELSTFTLLVITLERYNKIVFPLRKLKHFSFTEISLAMAVGWLLSLVVASLPLFGISSYSKVAICLPFDVTDLKSKMYVTILLSKNMIVFLMMFQCYGRMYNSLAGKSCAGSNMIERRVATRMAIIVFTNFACLFPISLLGLISIYHKSLVAVETSKFLMVFLFPIHSLSNPYLYAINTTSFKIDVLALLIRCGLCPLKLEIIQKRYQVVQVVPLSKPTHNSFFARAQSDQKDETYKNASRISAHEIFVRGSTFNVSQSYNEAQLRHYLRQVENVKLKKLKSCTDMNQLKGQWEIIQTPFYKRLRSISPAVVKSGF